MIRYGQAPEPRAHEVDQSPAIFCCATLTLLLQEGGGGVGNAVLPLFG
jgi:hypothetical protein